MNDAKEGIMLILKLNKQERLINFIEALKENINRRKSYI